MAASTSSSSHDKYILKQILDSTTHVVVDFRNYKKSCLALVLRIWLSEARTTWHCQYPRGVETETVEEYVRLNTAPDNNWPKYKVKILQEASSYEQGKRRLNRLLEGKDAYASNLGILEKIPVIGESGINNKHNKGNKGGNVDKHDRTHKSGETDKRVVTNKKANVDKHTTNKSDGADKEDEGNKSSDNDNLDTSKICLDDDKLDQGNKSGDNANSQLSGDDENSDKNHSPKDSNDTRSVSSDAGPTDTDEKNSTASSSGKSVSREDVRRLANKRKKPSTKRQLPVSSHKTQAKKSNADKERINIKNEITAAMLQMEEKLCKKFVRLNRACINEIKQQFNDLKEVVVPAESLRAVGETLSKCKATLDVNFPIEDIAEFLQLETALTDKNETQQALKKYMRLMQNGCATMNDSLSKILSAIMAKPLQLLYSGKGRVVKGKGKLNFSSTRVFSAMSELLVELHSCNPNQISSRTGKWLAGAGDRDGGKRKRDLETRPDTE